MTASDKRGGLFTAVQAAIDTACIGLAYMYAVSASAQLDVSIPFNRVNYLPYLVIVAVVWYGAAIDRRLWNARANKRFASYLNAVARAVGMATIFCVFCMALFTREGLDRQFLLFFGLSTLFLLLVVRSAIRAATMAQHVLGYGMRRCLIVGANTRADALALTLQERRYLGLRLLGIVDDDESRMAAFEGKNLPYLGDVDSLERICADQEIEDVYIALPFSSYYETIQHLTELCETHGIHAHFLADIFPAQIARSRLMHVADVPLLSLSTIPEAYAKLAAKRLIDFLGSTALILMALPTILIPTALLIKLTSRGPILFGQERVGQNQRRFNMLKFRSMVVDAEALRDGLIEENEADGPVFKIKDDPRITGVGRIIRRFSIDELPQLFNVWLGEMSLVGPRPPIPSEVEEYTWNQRRRLSVKPGMTGLWQVSGRSEVAFQEWVELDLIYIDNWSLAQDFSILLRTFKAVLSARGAS